MDIKDFTKAVGRSEIADAVGARWSTAVGNAVARGKFPADWYLAVKALAESKAVECPDALFNFKSPSSAPAQEAG